MAAHPTHCPWGSSGGPMKSRGHPCGTGRPCQGSRSSLSPLHRGTGHSPTNCCIALQAQTPWAASSPDKSKHSHIYLEDSVIPRSLRSGGRFQPLISISVHWPNITGTAACFLGCLVSRTSCPDMELLLTALFQLLKYA